jgi:hypothetical protein
LIAVKQALVEPSDNCCIANAPSDDQIMISASAEITPAGLAVLRARAEHDGSARPRCALRVYGMLGVGLMLFYLRGLYDRAMHADKSPRPAFWSLNIGMAMRVFMSLLPAGIYQAWASITKGLWYARSPEIIHSPVMESLVWLRVPGDIVFALGSVLLAAYALKLLRPFRRAAPASAHATPSLAAH